MQLLPQAFSEDAFMTQACLMRKNGMLDDKMLAPKGSLITV